MILTNPLPITSSHITPKFNVKNITGWQLFG